MSALRRFLHSIRPMEAVLLLIALAIIVAWTLTGPLL